MDKHYMHCPMCENYVGIRATDEELSGELGCEWVECPECWTSDIVANCIKHPQPRGPKYPNI